MQIGILTFHEGINHGGFFQAYCLYSAVKQLGFDVDIIHYKNRQHWKNEYKVFLLKRRIRPLIQNIRKILKFRADQRRMNLKGALVLDPAKLQTSQYDVIIVGSDIVWNYEWKFLGQDPIYFGHGLQASKLIAYAPSFGQVSGDAQAPPFVLDGLKKFSHISVRDNNSAQIVEQLTGRRPPIVLDPTFLYDTQGEEAKIKLPEKFLMVYSFMMDKEIRKRVQDYAKKHGLTTIAVGYPNPWCDLNAVNVSPFEWLTYFRHATAILTSTFHGTIFAIKYNKNFTIINNERVENKILTILQDIGLENRIANDAQSIERLLEESIDYSQVNPRLNKMVELSRSRLRSMLND